MAVVEKMTVFKIIFVGDGIWGRVLKVPSRGRLTNSFVINIVKLYSHRSVNLT